MQSLFPLPIDAGVSRGGFSWTFSFPLCPLPSWCSQMKSCLGSVRLKKGPQILWSFPVFVPVAIHNSLDSWFQAQLCHFLWYFWEALEWSRHLSSFAWLMQPFWTWCSSSLSRSHTIVQHIWRVSRWLRLDWGVTGYYRSSCIAKLTSFYIASTLYQIFFILWNLPEFIAMVS